MQYLFVVCRKKSSMKDSVLYCCSQCPSGPSVCQERNYFNLQKCAQFKKKRKENKSLKTEMLNAKEIKHGLPHCNTLGGFPITAGLIQSESQALLQKQHTSHSFECGKCVQGAAVQTAEGAEEGGKKAAGCGKKLETESTWEKCNPPSRRGGQSRKLMTRPEDMNAQKHNGV